MLDEKTRPVVEVLKRVVASGYVKNAYPLSCLLVAPVGAGKTSQLKKVMGNGIMALSDVTPYGFAKLLPEIQAKSIKHVIIFDLVEPMSRSRSVVNSLIGFLNSLVEEGIFRISTGFIEIREPIKLGLITSTTRKELEDKRRGWLGMGFISRMLPVSWSFTQTDVIQILEALAKNEIPEIKVEEIKIRERVVKGNEAVFQKLIPYAQAIDSRFPSPEAPLPFRRLNQLKIFLMANALLRGRTEVTEEDFQEFQTLTRWINLDFNPL